MILRTDDELQSDIDIPNQSEKERFLVNVSRIRSLETSADTYVDFYTSNAFKHGMDSFSVRTDFGSLQSTVLVSRRKTPEVTNDMRPSRGTKGSCTRQIALPAHSVDQ